LRSTGFQSLIIIMMNLKYLLAAILNENKAADTLYRANKEFFKEFFMPSLCVYRDFFRALVAAALARETIGWARRKRIREARRLYGKLEAQLIYCPDNIVNKLYLINAELEFCRGRYTTALLKYQKSIFFAKRERLRLDHALACEKAGRMLHQAGRYSESVQFTQQARELYLSWGALVKVNQIDAFIVSTKS